MNNKDKKLIDKYGGVEQLEKYILEISKVLGDVPIDAMKTVIENKDKELEKKDNIINLMSRAILNYDDQLVINKYRNKEEVKEYFEENYEELMKRYDR